MTFSKIISIVSEESNRNQRGAVVHKGDHLTLITDRYDDQKKCELLEWDEKREKSVEKKVSQKKILSRLLESSEGKNESFF
ncbi:MAG: hypothetical protein ACLFVB_05780 [Thermoplasmata archaeon]